MTNFLLILFCLGVGMALRAHRQMDERSVVALNAWLVYVAIPATAVVELRGAGWSQLFDWPAAMAWIIVAGAVVFLGAMGRVFGWSPKTVGAMILCGGVANTSFVGFPMLEAFYGPESIKTGILCDQLGTFLVIATVGMIVGARYSGHSLSIATIARRVVSYPAFLAVVFAFVAGPNLVPEAVYGVLARVEATLIPLALASIGMQLRPLNVNWRVVGAPLSWTLGYKLLLAPALFSIIAVGLGGARGFPIQVSILEAAMPSSVVASLLAIDMGLDRDVAGMSVLLGIPLSFASVAACWWMASGLA